MNILHSPKLLAAAALLALGATAHADPLASSASYQITSFSYVVSAGALSWNPTSAYQTLYSESNEAGGLLDNQILSSTDFQLTNAALSTNRAHASSTAAATAAGTLQGTASATPFVIAAISQPHSGSSVAQQSQEFSLSQAGSVTFTVGYSLLASSVTSNANENFALSSLDLAFGNYGNASGDSLNIGILSTDAANGLASSAGTLTFTVQFAAPGEVGFYNIRGNASAFASASVAVVPEPESYALMLAGLGVVGLVARRRSGLKR